MPSNRVLLVAIASIIAFGVALWVWDRATQPELVVSPYSATFEETREFPVSTGLCVHATVSGTLEGESRTVGAGNRQFSSGGSDIGDVDAEVVSPMITLSLTDGCDGEPVGVIAVKGVWGVALGPSGAEALSWTGDDDGVPGVALSFHFGGNGIDPAPVPTSTFASSNQGKRLAFDQRLDIDDSGFVCFDVVGRLTVSPDGASDWVPWAMVVCAI